MIVVVISMTPTVQNVLARILPSATTSTLMPTVNIGPSISVLEIMRLGWKKIVSRLVATVNLEIWPNVFSLNFSIQFLSIYCVLACNVFLSSEINLKSKLIDFLKLFFFTFYKIEMFIILYLFISRPLVWSCHTVGRLDRPTHDTQVRYRLQKFR